MEIEAVLADLEIEDSRAAIEPGWAESVAAMPDRPEFLSPEFVTEACAYVGFSREHTAAALRAAAAVSADPPLAALAWHGHRRIYGGGARVFNWPRSPRGLPEPGMFYVLLALSGFARARAFHEEHAIPPEVVAETLGDVELHIQEYEDRYGQPGLTPVNGGDWLKRHFQGRLYRLGRLQFLLTNFPKGQRVYRRADGRTVALVEGGIEFRRDGQQNGCSGIFETEGAWTSSLTEDPSHVAGHPIDPASGAAREQPVQLDASQWRPALQPGDPVLDLHIPAGQPLTPEACARSTARARDFFPQHFPDRPPAKALTCNTWMLDAQLEAYLDPTSNILRFGREFYLYPVESDPWTAIRSVFRLDIPYDYAGHVDVAGLPRDTSLQRALLDHVARGGRWRKAGGFLLAEDLPWGKQAYRGRPRPWE